MINQLKVVITQFSNSQPFGALERSLRANCRSRFVCAGETALDARVQGEQSNGVQYTGRTLTTYREQRSLARVGQLDYSR